MNELRRERERERCYHNIVAPRCCFYCYYIYIYYVNDPCVLMAIY